MPILKILRKIFGSQRQVNVLGAQAEDGLIEMSYEHFQGRKELVVYLYLDMDVGEITVAPLNDNELAVISRNRGIIGVLEIKRPYRRNDVEVERKQKTLKIKLVLKS